MSYFSLFHTSFDMLISNPLFYNIYSNSEHIESVDEYLERYRDILSNFENNTVALASLITIRNYSKINSREKKEVFKKYLIKNIEKSNFVKNKENNEKLISIILELIQEEKLPDNKINVKQYLETEKNIKLKVPKSYQFYYELIESVLIAASLSRFMNLSIYEEFKGFVDMDIEYFASIYNKHIYYKLHVEVIEYILDSQLESKEQILVEGGLMSRIAHSNKYNDVDNQPGRKEFEETSQEKVCKAVKKILIDEKLEKKFLRQSGKLKGTYNLDGISNYLFKNDFKKVVNPIGKRMLREKVRLCLPKDKVPGKTKY